MKTRARLEKRTMNHQRNNIRVRTRIMHSRLQNEANDHLRRASYIGVRCVLLWLPTPPTTSDLHALTTSMNLYSGITSENGVLEST